MEKIDLILNYYKDKQYTEGATFDPQNRRWGELRQGLSPNGIEFL
jgi:hypothetical protein